MAVLSKFVVFESRAARDPIAGLYSSPANFATAFPRELATTPRESWFRDTDEGCGA